MVHSGKAILFFDGVCDLCNGFVQFFIKRDKGNRFLFASLQSLAGTKALEAVRTQTGNTPDSIILFYKGRYYQESAAVLYALAMLGGFWRLVAVGRLIPQAIRDRVYKWVARNRYNWFGKREECMVPTPELQSRFISDQF